jgi:hut operon positive regulator
MALEEGGSNGIGYYAIRLALTRTIAEENELKEEYRKKGLRFAVTEIGGRSSTDFYSKLLRAVTGAALNERVIKKRGGDIHALMHASEEAQSGIRINFHFETHLALKVAIVRNSHWIAVAMFGESAMHTLTNHERCGLGIMHLDS